MTTTSTQTRLNVNPVLASNQPQPFSYRAMWKANRFYVLHFSHYQPLYKLPLEVFFRDCGPILSFHFSMVYGADLELEAAQENKIAYNGVIPWVQRRQEFIGLLKELNFYLPEIEKELSNTTRYWELEDIMFLENKVTPDNLVEMLDVIPGDVIAAHYVCHQLLGLPIHKNRMMAIRSLEVVEEMEAQLLEYRDDLAKNNFNIYRMFVRCYGTAAAEQMEAEHRRRLQIFQDCVATLPVDEQESFAEVFRYRGEFHQKYYFLDKPTIPTVPQPVLETT